VKIPISWPPVPGDGDRNCGIVVEGGGRIALSSNPNHVVIVPSHPVEVNEKIESVRLFFSKRSVLSRGSKMTLGEDPHAFP
jgi:hypothetical protein